MFASIMRGAKIFHSKRLQRCGLFVIGGGDGKSQRRIRIKEVENRSMNLV